MPKQNSANLFNRYIWLVNVIYSSGYITKEEIDRRWNRSVLSDDDMVFPLRTFHRYKDAIEELFHVVISYDKHKGYFIKNSDSIAQNSLRKWLVSNFAIENMLFEKQNLQPYIALEQMPSGQQFLTTILDAIENRLQLEVKHKGFSKDEPTTFRIKPFGVKVFKQRCYVLAESQYEDRQLRVYGLDRFVDVKLTADQYDIPEDFDVADYFRATYGVSAIKRRQEIVVVRIRAEQANYLRSLPLHHTQKEIKCEKDYSLFELFVAPSYELKQEILTHGADIEVLEPEWFRHEIAHEIEKMSKIYHIRHK